MNARARGGRARRASHTRRNHRRHDTPPPPPTPTVPSIDNVNIFPGLGGKTTTSYDRREDADKPAMTDCFAHPDSDKRRRDVDSLIINVKEDNIREIYKYVNNFKRIIFIK